MLRLRWLAAEHMYRRVMSHSNRFMTLTTADEAQVDNESERNQRQ